MTATLKGTWLYTNRDFGYSTGLVLLGKVHRGMELLNVPGPVKVTIERDE